MSWETVIGLEVHVQLATRSKLFCGCPASFGEAPNTAVCPVCLGLPGALPVPNAEAVRLGVRAALALGAEVHVLSVFARKNYFYPDLPKGYQISQFDQPLATRGAVECESPERGPVRIGITRLHLEEDAGKLLHDRVPGHTAIDLNRAGVPLAEIVSEPELRSPAEARSYLNVLKQTLLYAGVSECSMEKGSLRVDANVSVRRAGETELGTKTEIKNMNSFANTERAIALERDRQQSVLAAGGTIEQVTLLFDAENGALKAMRSKEESHDYRYFPDPDLPPLVLDGAWIEQELASLPELPAARRRRWARDLKLSDYDTGVLTAERPVADYFQSLIDLGVDAKTGANWIMGEVMAAFKTTGTLLVPVALLAELIELVADGKVSLQAARSIFPELAEAESALVVAERRGLLQVRDGAALSDWVDAVITAHPAEVARYRGGEAKLIGFLVGQVMKRSGGKADPKVVSTLLAERLAT